MKYCNMSLLSDNQSLKSICQYQQRIEQPGLPEYNQHLAQIYSHFLSPLYQHYNYYQFNSLSYLEQNIVFYPILNFMLPAYSPFTIDEHPLTLHSLDTLTIGVFTSQNYTLTIESPSHHYIASALLFRGAFQHSDIHDSVLNIRKLRSVNFLDNTNKSIFISSAVNGQFTKPK